MPCFTIEDDPGRDFWESVYLNFVPQCSAEVAAAAADQSLNLWKERWKHEIKELCLPAEFAGISSKPQPPIETLIKAQEKVESLKQMVQSIRDLADQMPKDLGEAYYGVGGKIAEEQLADAEQWLSNIQSQMENQP